MNKAITTGQATLDALKQLQETNLHVSPINLALIMLAILTITTYLFYRRSFSANPRTPDLDYIQAIDKQSSLKIKAPK